MNAVYSARKTFCIKTRDGSMLVHIRNAKLEDD